MIDINLLPWREEQLKRERVTTITLLIISFALAFIFTIIVHFSFSTKVNQQKSRNNALSSEIKNTNLMMQDNEKLKEQKLLLSNQLKTMEGIQLDRYQTVMLFNEITEIIPKPILLSSFVREDNIITLSGEAYTNQAVPSLVKRIDQNLHLDKPAITEITSQSLNGRNITAFKINFHLIDKKPKLTPVKKPTSGK